ncbi:envelope-like protein, partial [Trifolium medium]|nr:envelope-like protein [Trifolium medium]
GMSECYETLVREFLVNIPEDCDDPLSKEYQKVFVRGKCVEFSPTIINKALENVDESQPDIE